MRFHFWTSSSPFQSDFFYKMKTLFNYSIDGSKGGAGNCFNLGLQSKFIYIIFQEQSLTHIYKFVELTIKFQSKYITQNINK